MATVNVVNWNNEKVGEIELPDDVFAGPIRKDVLHSVVRWQQANRRQGTHMTKTKGLVSGGGKKPFKQKGTGNARQGSSRSPLMPGGGITFGPLPRDYSFSMPKKVRLLALKSALSHLQKEGRVFVLDDMSSSGKTKDVAEKVKCFSLPKALLADSRENAMLKRASKNLKNVKFVPVEAVNVFDLLKYDSLLVSKQMLGELVLKLRGGADA